MATYPSIGSTNWTAPLKNYIDATSGVTRQKFADLTYPITTGHSGAGKLIFPDGTIDTNRIAEAMHLPIIDCGDFRLQQDGSFVNIHSSVLNTVTNVAGNPYALSASLAHQIILNPALYYNNPPIGEFFPLTTWEDVAREFGARVLLTPELKIDGTYPFTAGSSGTAFLAKLQATGMTDSVMVNSFSLAELTPLIAGGIPVMLNTSGDQSGGPAIATNTAAYAAGVRHLAIDIVVNTPAVVATYKSIGFKVWAYDVQNQYDSAAWLAGGADVIMSDDPMYSSGVTASYRRTVDVFALGAFPSGMLPASGLAIDRGTLAYGRWTPRTNTSGGTGLGFLSPVASPAGTYTLGFTVCFDNLGSDLTRHADVAIAALDDRYWDFSTARSVNSGYTVVVRPDSLNQFGVFEVVAGVTTSKANTNNGPVTTSGALSSGVAITTIPVTSTASFINSGFKYLLPTGQQATVSTDTNAGATTLPVSSITPSALVPSGTTLTSVLRIVAPLVTTSTLAAGVAITTIPVSAVALPIASGAKFALPSVDATSKPQFAVTSANVATGATSIPVTSITPVTAVPSGSSLPQGADVTVRVTPTTIVVTRTDIALTTTATSSAVRGGYIHGGLNNSAGASGMVVSFSKMSVT
jgi:glycerophosphoryl diester phosphodiesterase